VVAVACLMNPESVSGFRTKLVGPPLTVAVRGPLVQEIWNQLPVTFTGSSKLIVMFPSLGTCVSLFAGEVANISGSKSPTGQTVIAVELLRGFGDPVKKFPPFESVSLQPRCDLKSAVTFSNPWDGSVQ